MFYGFETQWALSWLDCSTLLPKTMLHVAQVSIVQCSNAKLFWIFLNEALVMTVNVIITYFNQVPFNVLQDKVMRHLVKEALSKSNNNWMFCVIKAKEVKSEVRGVEKAKARLNMPAMSMNVISDKHKKSCFLVRNLAFLLNAQMKLKTFTRNNNNSQQTSSDLSGFQCMKRWIIDIRLGFM